MSNNPSQYWAIVPAAGSGSRMGSDRPKQYLSLHGKLVLQHTLERLHVPGIAGVVVCVANDDPYWRDFTFKLPIPLWRAEGGKERCHSVLNALQILLSFAQPQDWVLVHDAARPCVRKQDIEHLMTQVANHPVGGLLALPVCDTMKRADNQGTIVETVSRVNLWHALTPQMFRLDILLRALQKVINQGEIVTDDAQAIEKAGYRPMLVEGHADNIKITHPQDLQLAELFLQQQCVSKPA